MKTKLIAGTHIAKQSWQQVQQVFKKKFWVILGLLFVLSICTYVRLFPAFMPQFKRQAKMMMEQRTMQIVSQDVFKRFPQFNILAQNKLITNRIAEYKRQNKFQLNQETNALYKQLKSRFQDDTGQTYLMELDCWHWSRYVENVLVKGSPGDERVDGQEWDLFMLAPLGSYLHWDNFLFYFSAFVYKIYCIIAPIPLFQFLFYLPLLFSIAFLGVLFFFCLRCQSNVLGAISACFFIGLSQIFLPRSCAGWFDKDILNLLFPLLALWAYAASISSDAIKKRVLFAVCAGFWIGLFCFDWTFWWFILAILVGYEAVFLSVLLVARFAFGRQVKERVSQHVISLFTLLGSTLFWILVLSGTKPLEALYKQMLLAVVLNKPLMASIWPNVYSTVGELRGLSFKEIAGSAGGYFIFITAIIASLSVIIRLVFYRAYSGIRLHAFLMLAIWAVAMSMASARGIRFVVFLLVPLSVFLSVALGEVYSYFRSHLNRWLASGVIIFAIIFNWICINQGFDLAGKIYPLMNDTWYNVLTIIKDRTPKETIINSWWDFGDWFKVAGRRRVIFDGQSQDTPQAYWMAKAMLSNNEKQSIAILRMLNNGGNKAFEIINEHLKDPLKSVLFLEKVLLLEPEDARSALLEVLPVPAAESVLKILYAIPSKACFLVDSTLLGKMPAVSYLGNWDFAKVYLAQNFNSHEKESIIDYLVKLGRDRGEMQKFYQEAFLIPKENLDEWLSQKVMFYSELFSGREKDGLVYFENGLIYDKRQQTVRGDYGPIPKSIFVLDGNDIREITNLNSTSPVSLIVVETKEGYKGVLADPSLGKSVFSRLYFFNGQGLKHFLPFIDADEGGRYIRTFFISW